MAPPKVQAKQDLLTPPATDGCLSVTQSMALSCLLPGLFPETLLLLSKKKMDRSLSPSLCLSHHPTEKLQWRAGQADPPADVPVKLVREVLLPVRTPGSVTQPQPSLGAHLGTLDHFLARGLRLPMSPGRLMLHLIHIIYGLGDRKCYQTYTL